MVNRLDEVKNVLGKEQNASQRQINEQVGWESAKLSLERWREPTKDKSGLVPSREGEKLSLNECEVTSKDKLIAQKRNFVSKVPDAEDGT